LSITGLRGSFLSSEEDSAVCVCEPLEQMTLQLFDWRSPPTPSPSAVLRVLPILALRAVQLPHTEGRFHLHEPRYRRLVKDVTEKDSLFGLLLIDPHRRLAAIGSVLEIIDVQKWADGRYDVQARGKERFRLIQVLQEENEDLERYLTGVVEIIEVDTDFDEDDRRYDNSGQPADNRVTLAWLRRAIWNSCEEIISLHGMLYGGRHTPLQQSWSRLHPMDTSFVFGDMLNVPVFIRQLMLQTTSTRQRLEYLLRILSADRRFRDAQVYLKTAFLKAGKQTEADEAGEQPKQQAAQWPFGESAAVTSVVFQDQLEIEPISGTAAARVSAEGTDG